MCIIFLRLRRVTMQNLRMPTNGRNTNGVSIFMVIAIVGHFWELRRAPKAGSFLATKW